MLGKLLKHEFRATGRIMLPALGALILLAGLANLSYRGIEYNAATAEGPFAVFVRLVLLFTIILFFLGLFAAVVMSVVLMVQRFYRNLMRDEGYLMFTLPVSVHGLVWSKLIVSFVWITLTGLIATALFLLTILNFASVGFAEFFGFWPEVMAELTENLRELGITPAYLNGTLVFYICLMIVSTLSSCLHFYAAMAIGHSFAKDKVLLSIVFFIAISFGFQILSTALSIGLVPLLENYLEAIDFQGTGDAYRLFNSLWAYSGVLALLQGVILYFLTVIPLKKGLNLA